MDNRRKSTATHLDPSDRRGIAADLPPSQLNKRLRGNLTRNRRSSYGATLHDKTKNDMKIQLHGIEQKAYSAVLLAFSGRCNTLTWEQESLLAGLRTELRVTNEEHKELLITVKSDDILLKIRESRHAAGFQSDSFKHAGPELPQPPPAVSAMQKSNKSSPLSLEAPLPSIRSLPLSTRSQPFSSDAEGAAIDKKIKSSQNLPIASSLKSAKRHPMASTGSTVGGQVMNKQSNDVPAIDGPAKNGPYSLIGQKTMIKGPADNNFYEAFINDYNQSKDLHLIYDMGTKDETREWVNLKEISPEHIRWDCEEPIIHRHTDRDTEDQDLGDKKSHGGGALTGGGMGTSTIKSKSKKDLSLSQNGISKKRKGDYIEILHSETLIMELDKIFSGSHSDPRDIKKAKRIIEQHEQSLIDAIETLVRFSDGESDKYTPAGNPTSKELIIRADGDGFLPGIVLNQMTDNADN